MYKGKTVLITGTGRGVGMELAKHFYSHNATVIGIDHDCKEVVYKQYSADLSIPDDITDVFEQIKKVHPKIDICINNAAVLTSQYSTKMPIEGAEDMVNVDLLAVFLVSRECAKLMKKSEYGRIINISSMAVALEPMGDSMYAACKAGINVLANIMAKEYAFMNVTCNTLAISAIETDMLKQLNKENIDKVVASLPIPRYATMNDITNVIDFFCSPDSGYITAQTIYLGGVHA